MKKPRVKLVGQDGNVFNLLGLAARELRRAGQSEQATKMRAEAMSAGSYDEALQVIMQYCDVC